MPYLLERREGPRILREEVAGETLRIGRGTNAALRFDDDAVSLEHAIILQDAQGYLLSDLGSVTGTYVDGRPIDSARLSDGNRIEVGGFTIEVGLAQPDAPLTLRVRPTIGPLAAVVLAQVESPPIDYVAAYELRRRPFGKGTVTLVLTLVASVVVIALPLTGKPAAFRPGQLSEAHVRVIAAGDCTRCHAPWLGASDSRCAVCHRDKAVHQARQLFAPPCGGCHTEHRSRARLAQVGNRACTACHGDLAVTGGGAPAVARRVTDFGSDHPEISVLVAESPGGLARRLSLSDPAALRADRAAIRLDHALHLKPGLIGPDGRETLACDACHVTDPAGGQMRPISFELHCRRCHGLAFDERLPDQQAPHDVPERVFAALLAVYSGNQRLFQSLSTDELRRRVFRGAGGGLNLAEGVETRAFRAADQVFRNRCGVCHQMHLDAKPLATVEPTRIPARWFWGARFDHTVHRASPCERCHTGAAASHETADVLLPGIAVCRPCHGGAETTASGARPEVASACVTCHTYHGSGIASVPPGAPLPSLLPAPVAGSASTAGTVGVVVERTAGVP